MRASDGESPSCINVESGPPKAALFGEGIDTDVSARSASASLRGVGASNKTDKGIAAPVPSLSLDKT